ncbi:pyridoxal phosphate-dependent transferase [Phyllosticta citribraziliensis]|uniref:Pyridoxal phosphate-dependent transferase n=1 Tax=Phyllosticta citribraziliensis TaxID=989973 RepID=A0ABR1LHZ3_9PEZI
MSSPPSSSSSSSKPLINLLRGWPSTSLLPASLLKRAADTALTTPSIAHPGLLYGPDPGHPSLRKSVAAWLTDFYRPQQPVRDDRICISGGASQNLGCLLQVFTDPIYTRAIWISSPAYMLAFRIFDDAGFHAKLRSVPEDDAGMDVDFLRREIEKTDDDDQEHRGDPSFKTQIVDAIGLRQMLKPKRPWSKFYRHVIYVVPNHSNPSSVSMSLERRQQLVRLARDFDCLVICDDVYDFLQWPAASAEGRGHPDPRRCSLPRIVDIDRFLDGGAEGPGRDGFGNVASNGSFSKICGPGLRTGWLEGTPKLAHGVSQAGTTRSGGAPSQLTSTYVSLLLEWGELQQHVYGTLQPALAARYRTMVSAIERHLVPVGVTFARPGREVAGGYFVWLSLPAPLTGVEVARIAREEQNLIVAEGQMFEVPGDSARINFPRDVRVCFAWEPEDMVEQGIQRLGQVIQEVQRRGQTVAEGGSIDGIQRETDEHGRKQNGDGQGGANYW